MEIFDCHVHVEKGLDLYNLNVSGKNIIFNDISSYKELSPLYTDSTSAVSLVFDYKNHLEFIVNEIDQNKIKALKIHSRIQKLVDADYDDLMESLEAIGSNIPVIIDAFYYGAPLEVQPNLKRILQLATRFPQRKFIIAHSGGYEVLKYFFHLREFKNIVYDLSVSLQYLYDSSVFMDLKKLIKFTDKKRILFGSDYPFADPLVQFEILNALLDELGVESGSKQAIIYSNALEIFK